MSRLLSEEGRTGEGDPRAPNRVLYETVDINNMQKRKLQEQREEDISLLCTI